MQREVLIPHEVIARRVRELAGELDRHYAGEEVVVVGVLMGSFVFMADLVRNLSFPCLIDFVRLASYGSGTESTGQVMMRKDLETEITGRHVLVVEDIVDTGITLDFWFRRCGDGHQCPFPSVYSWISQPVVRCPSRRIM